MSSGADLFVVCKRCGSEVSPYITECPYCGHRLRRRAPKLPREGESPARRRTPSSLGRLRPGEIPGLRADASPYVTAALLVVTGVVWIAWRANLVALGDVVVNGPLHGQWWRLFTTQFVYISGLEQFAVLIAVAVFGWLLERRHGPLLVASLFLAGGVSGTLVDLAVHRSPLIVGGNGAALALLGAWVLPDLLALRSRSYYDGDLLGAGAFAAVLLALPLARPETSWLAGVTGALLGLLMGAGLHRMHPR